jgi:hypothetical protein
MSIDGLALDLALLILWRAGWSVIAQRKRSLDDCVRHAAGLRKLWSVN